MSKDAQLQKWLQVQVLHEIHQHHIISGCDYTVSGYRSQVFFNDQTLHMT